MILPSYAEPEIKDNDYVIQKYVSGFASGVTTMAFEGNDILVLQKDDGQVRVVHNGTLQNKAALDENITHEGEQGMLGIAVVGKKVYLYFTESDHDGGSPLGKRVYLYDWNGKELVNKTLIKDLSQTQTYHNGGAMVTSHNGSVYLVVGDAGRYGLLQNSPDDKQNDTSVIFRISPPGPYYAMGIRNSFGLTEDPITHQLWDTENGPDFFDEINLANPNFNSGWDAIMGPANATQIANLAGYKNYKYHDPQFSWQTTVAPTGLSFIDSKEFEKYKNSLFVGDCNNGNLYKFELNKDRNGFVFKSPFLQDKVLNIGESMDEILFGTGFGCITDVVAGPDGLLYVVSHTDGAIYRIIPKSMLDKEQVATTDPSVNTDNLPVKMDNSFIIYFAGLIVIGIILFFILKRWYRDKSKQERKISY